MNITKFLYYSVSFAFTTGMFIFLVRRAKSRLHKELWTWFCLLVSCLWLGVYKGAIAYGIAWFFTSDFVRSTLFEYFNVRLFLARVQTNLMAQHKDQSFTNTLCQKPEHLEYINFVRENSYFKRDKIAPFLVVCGLLGRGLEDNSLSNEQRTLCARLLADRLHRVNADQHFRLKHIFIFGELEDKLESWIINHTSIYEAI
jgi:hypothetical protein